MKRRIMALLLTVVAVLGIATYAPARAAAEPRASEYIASTGVFVYAMGNGKIKIEVDVAATHQMLEVGASVVHLYEKQSNGTVTKVASYYKEDHPAIMLEYNSFFAYMDLYYYGAVPGRQYYAVAGCYAKDSVGNETLYFTSNTVVAT